VALNAWLTGIIDRVRGRTISALQSPQRILPENVDRVTLNVEFRTASADSEPRFRFVKEDWSTVSYGTQYRSLREAT